ncbi:NADPH-dependent F420 reductase [Sphingomonas jatrophae]|uniref:Pyrroline-5-carboxylate reductase catalytic N-terminal domain-containing protein n=1 Tax=Sphingomonas jatrophae TaxID=1166337 RepID=A0A1I6KC76_9SPHN|nr:NAD(P)-binding domain-containing protein [Sphingomonas jatrophae]SFR88819.1 hypothetical protein SAMN05192580_1561 [Sphingomonas jatrophae]
MWQVGIIGAGGIGSAVARRLVPLGAEVRMANSRGPASLADKAAAIGIVPVTVEAAATARDFVLIAIPQHAVAALPPGLFAQTPADTIVLDANNHYPIRDGEIAAIEAGMPDSVWVAERIGRPVLKMFNTIHAATIVDGGHPKGTPGRICVPIAGDDMAAKRKAIDLAEALGFDGLDAGPLAESWRQQPGTAGYCRNLDLPAMRDALAASQSDLVATYRAEALAKARAMTAEALARSRA